MIKAGEKHKYRIKIKKILDGDYYNIQTVNPDDLVRKDGKIYVPNDIAVRKKFFYLNHNNPQ